MAIKLPPVFIPHEGMSLNEIPVVENLDELQGFVKPSLLLVSSEKKTTFQLGPDGEAKAVPIVNKSISLKLGYTNIPPSEDGAAQQYISADEKDVLFKWKDIQARGGKNWDGVFQSHGKIYFWDNGTNNFCSDDLNQRTSTAFPIPLTEEEGLHLTQATGLSTESQACITSPAEESGKKHYNFAFDPTQIDTYLSRLEMFHEKNPQVFADKRYDEIKDALKKLKPPTHVDIGIIIFIAGAVGAAIVHSIGSSFIKKLFGNGNPPSAGGSAGNAANGAVAGGIAGAIAAAASKAAPPRSNPFKDPAPEAEKAAEAADEAARNMAKTAIMAAAATASAQIVINNVSHRMGSLSRISTFAETFLKFAGRASLAAEAAMGSLMLCIGCERANPNFLDPYNGPI